MIGLTLANSAKLRFCQTVSSKKKKGTGMIFHAFGCIYFNFFDFQNFDLKNVFLQTQNGFSQNGLILKVWTFYLAPFKSYLTKCAQNSKANFPVALRPLKLQIAEKVLRPMKFRPKTSVFTYPHPFWKVVVPIQVLWSHSTCMCKIWSHF